MNNFNASYSATKDVKGLNAYMSKVFSWMFLGLLISFGIAFFTSRSVAILSVIMNPIVLMGLFISELILVVVLSRNAMNYSYGKASALFVIYALINGFTLSGIFVVYNLGSIALVFLASSLLFGGMAIYGKVTKKDLSGMGSIMFMLLLGLIIAAVVNMFLGSTMLDLLIGAAGATIFAGLTAWDMQKLKNYYYKNGEGSESNNVAVVGALMLYLDFINIFLSLLRIFGRD